MKITAAHLKRIAPRGRATILEDVATELNDALPDYGITTALRFAHFIAQAAKESDGFETLTEYWGPTAAQKKYEGRADLGNVKKGDGYLFRGRGIFQLTGRANYHEFGKKLLADFEQYPDMVSTGRYAVLTALEYWKARGLNALADKDDVVAVTKKINGGTNGLDDRKIYLERARIVAAELFPTPVVAPAPVASVAKPVTLAQAPAKTWWQRLLRL